MPGAKTANIPFGHAETYELEWGELYHVYGILAPLQYTSFTMGF